MGLNLVSGGVSAGGKKWGRGGSRRPINEINMTPFIDVMLVLLIIFMISAPMLSTGVAVDLPKAGAPSLKDPTQPLDIRVTKDGITLQDQEIKLPQLAAKMAAIAENKKDTPVHLRADRQLSYEQVMQVIATVRGAGFTKLALVTEHPPVDAAPAAGDKMTTAVASDYEMKAPVAISFILHGALLLALIIGLPHLKQKPLEMMQQIPIDIMDVGPVTTTQKIGTGNTAKVDLAPPPPAPPAPQVKPAPPQQKDVARAMPKDDGPTIADKKIPPKKIEKVEKKEDKPDPQQFSSLLKNLAVDKPKPTEAPPQVTQEKPKAAAPTGTQGIVSDHLTISQEDALKRQIEEVCWSPPIGAKDIQDMVVQIHVEVNPDRTVKSAQIVSNDQMGNSFYRALAESAQRAMLNPKCSPLQLPEDQYDKWKTMTLNFSPKDMM